MRNKLNLYEIAGLLVVAPNEVEAHKLADGYAGGIEDDDAVRRLSWKQMTMWSVDGCGEFLTVGEGGAFGTDGEGDSEVTYQDVFDYYMARGGKFPGILGQSEYC